MVVREFYMTRSDGVDLYRSYSDAGYYIERDGVVYEEAVDPDGTDRVYTETEDLIPVQELSPEEALAIITGGEV